MSKSQLKKNFFEDKIDTNQSAQNFIKLLAENQTIFLNGEWGTGKSTFLKNVEKLSVKDQKKVFVFMDLWRFDNSQSLITTAFRKLSPQYYWVTRSLIVFSVIISISMTNVVKIPFSFDTFVTVMNPIIQYFPTFNFLPLPNYIFDTVNIIFFLTKFLGLILVLSVSVSQLLKINYFDFDAYLFSKKALKDKVLVIDDFDRLSESKQKDTYKLLSFLNGKLPIIFVGSYDRIITDDKTEIFLSKIIDRRVELPMVLWPSEIWYSVFKFTNTTYNINLSVEFKNIFIEEQKNLRDRAHFIDYIYQELIIRGKLYHVQIEDQLIIIYTYIFHHKIYNELFIKKDDVSEVLSKLEKSRDTFDLVLFSVLNSENDEYPVQFKKNPSIYFLFETPTNLTTTEIERQLQDASKLNEYLVSNSNSDFYNYIISSFHSLKKSSRVLLFNSALQLFNEQKNSDTISYLVSEKNQELLPNKKPLALGNGSIGYSVPEELVDKSNEEIQQMRYAKWRPILENAKYDISQQLKFFATFHIAGLKYLNGYYIDIPSIIKSCLVNDYVSPEYVLLEYISELNQWYLFAKWEDTIWEYIKKLPDESLINFLKIQDVIRKSEKPNPKDYKLMLASLDFDNGGLRENTIVIKELGDRLKKLRDNNYVLTEETD